MSPREPESTRKLAKTTVMVFAQLARNFAEPDQRHEPVPTVELQLMERYLDNADRLLGEEHDVAPLVAELKAAVLGALSGNEPLTYDIAKQRLRLVAITIVSEYGLDPSFVSHAAKRRKRVDVRIDTDHHDDAGRSADP